MSVKAWSYLLSIGGQNPHFTPCSGLSSFRQLTLKKNIDQPELFSQHFTHKYGISSRNPSSSKNISFRILSSSTPPSDSSSNSSWKKWLMGVVFSIVLPAAGHKGGAFVALKAKIDETIATVDTVTDIVENIAETADKLVDEVESKLPEDSSLKKTVEALDDLTDVALQHARKADDLVDQVKELKEDLFENVITSADENDTDVDEDKNPKKPIN